ncbi:MAG TPA: right-handed parallel beta-helix repeat-containing protein [Thermoanaerobaculia bacterium]|nr:right-handed parallel beta-helix repeat-containing protein [Thermoanaerobaculia bacterium]
MRSFIVALFVLLSTALSAQVADVRLVPQSSRPTELEPGDFGEMTLAIQNLGPDVARNLRVEFRASSGVTFRQQDPNCTDSEPGLRICPFGDFAPGLTYSGAEYVMPFAAGTHSVTATLLTDSTDPEPANNRATLTYQTERISGVLISPFSFRQRVEPGGIADVPVSVFRPSLTTAPIPAGTIIEARLSVTNGATIESIEAPRWSCSLGGATATCRTTASGGECCGELRMRVRAPESRAGGEVRVNAEAVVQHPALDLPSTGSASFDVFRIAAVTNVQDSGPGSLRAAIEDVNEHCSTLSCRIVFELPGEAPHTIVPAAPLPPIVADRILIEALKTPVILDGTAAGKGLEMHVACEGVVSGLTFRNFHATEGLWYTTRRPCVSENWERRYFIFDNRFERNRRGLILDGAPMPLVQGNLFRENTFSGIWIWRGSAWLQYNDIEDNGASGVFIGPAVRETHLLWNRIRGNREMGVAVARGAGHIDIQSNNISDNGGLGIDWGLDGVTPPREDDSATETNAPTILGAYYDAPSNQTQVTLSVRTRITPAFPGGYVVVELFANGKPDGDGEVLLGASVVPPDGTPVTLFVTGDHRGKWINATASRVGRIYFDRSTPFGDRPATSELSHSVQVP